MQGYSVAKAWTLLAAGWLLSAAAQAATPASATLTDTSGAKTYTAGPFVAPNQTPNLNVDVGPRCSDPAMPCDSFALTVALPANYTTAHPYDRVKVTLSWTSSVPASTGAASDYDIYAYQGAVDTLDGSKRAYTDSATAKNPESFTLPALGGTNLYTLKTVPFMPGGESILVRIELVAGVPPNTAAGSPPRYRIYPSPALLGNSAGEPSIGYNLKSKNAMFLANLQALRVTFAENSGAKDEAGLALPESCDASWQNKSATITSTTTLDPILFTERQSGRSFISQQTTGAQALFSFTDDDGETYTQASASPPSGGADHQTIVAGPYPAGSQFAAVANAAGIKYATYYCAQNVVSAVCARSDSGGASFGPGVPIFTAPESTVRPVDNQADCNTFDGGIHGHVKIAPDGTVYVPPKDCGSVALGIVQAVIVSEDAGLTWDTRLIPGTSADTEIDPAVGIDAANTVYDCYVAHDGHQHAIVSKDRGKTWSNDQDIGALAGVETADFPVAIGGDAGRAACGFLGTSTRGNHDAPDFKGIWYNYISQTYDGGKSWHTVNVTPDDPVQGVGGVCNGGTLCSGGNRNLLDFNEITLDERGRPLYGFADGCIGDCAKDPIGKAAFSRKATIVRLTGGRSLYAAFDQQEPAKPAASCIAGNRTVVRSRLNWALPDNGGAEIVKYNIFRSLSPTAFSSTPIATTLDAKSTYDDATADPNVPVYYYKITAINSQGEGIYSNTIKLGIAGEDLNLCKVPGLTALTDPAGDVFVTNNATPPQTGLSAYDLLQLSVAQPYFANGDYKYVFQLKTGSLANLPPSSTWAVNFCTSAFPCTGSNAALSATNKYYTLQMVNNTGTPVFQLLKPNAADLTRATVTAEADSNFTATGLITLVVKATDLGFTKPTAGTDLLSNFLVMSFNTARNADTMPNLGAPVGSITSVPLAQCAPNTAPLAALTVTPRTGNAPQSVQFDGSGSLDSDATDTVASFNFDFGDGSTLLGQSSSKTSHVYTKPGDYKASLTVMDSRGLVSANVAEQVIQLKAGTVTGTPGVGVIAQPGSSGSTPVATGRFGGGAPGLLLLALFGLAARFRGRRPH